MKGVRSSRSKPLARTTRPSHPCQPYTIINDAPKVPNLEKAFAGEWRDESVQAGEKGNERHSKT